MGTLTSRKAIAVDPQHLKSRVTQRVGYQKLLHQYQLNS